MFHHFNKTAKRLILVAHHSAIIPLLFKALESVVQIRCN